MEVLISLGDKQATPKIKYRVLYTHKKIKGDKVTIVVTNCDSPDDALYKIANGGQDTEGYDKRVLEQNSNYRLVRVEEDIEMV